jgi:uncharacterized protein YcbX
MITISGINIYPIKSCKGTALQSARIGEMGFEHDREWLIVRADGRFITQREEPRLALLEPTFAGSTLRLNAPEMPSLDVPADLASNPVEVICWRDRCAAFDAGPAAADWLSGYLKSPHRLVRFDAARKRASSVEWTRGIEALNQFSDGFPFLVISQASLDDLNSRLSTPLPMNRFRPNIVIDGVSAYAEDQIKELSAGEVTLRIVKPCTRCAVTTTDQTRGERDGDEPLRTLRSYRFSRELKGVLFGQNVILVNGLGSELRVNSDADFLHFVRESTQAFRLPAEAILARCVLTHFTLNCSDVRRDSTDNSALPVLTHERAVRIELFFLLAGISTRQFRHLYRGVIFFGQRVRNRGSVFNCHNLGRCESEAEITVSW